MPTIATGDILETRTFTECNDQLGINVRQWRVQSINGTGATFQEATDEFSDGISTGLRDCMSNAAQFHGVGLRRLTPNPTLEFTSLSSAGAGLQVGDVMPGQVAGVITLKTDTPGRKGRGRAYIPFPTDVDGETDGTPLAGYVTRLTTLANLYTNIMTLEPSPGNNVKIQPLVYNRPTKTGLDITSSIARDYWGTQRRRQMGLSGDVNPLA